MKGDQANIDIDAGLIPLQTQQQAAAASQQQAALVAGQLRTLAGQLGPDISIATAAPLNGVAVTHTPAANTLTFGLSGVGTMAQRNAIVAVADIATADATDLASVITLANALKAKVNELLAAMRTASHLVP